ncbi:hypothetical protein CC1G_14229 [Coprinopsis cinerea okayama7|uniref:Uncharacterized protein n=1 Tax=Coprinopsis cinerea (strain Okayama-7 / 130 / ATCC MYA-4618 / FGSC 9003) TaxID=240176 RepID=D6RL94_COPC7|nr:hypothetical protein CC1G_14229 [Coprinopsis cinerea okayama7\|eukprot:XP_002911696.1 hypothetical protein CC1G_14229 [Coprinopsis cinerea okayama7\
MRECEREVNEEGVRRASSHLKRGGESNMKKVTTGKKKKKNEVLYVYVFCAT